MNSYAEMEQYDVYWNNDSIRTPEQVRGSSRQVEITEAGLS